MENNTKMFLVCFATMLLILLIYLVKKFEIPLCGKRRIKKPLPVFKNVIQSDTIECFEQIGYGKFGTVYRGEMLENDRKVTIALKFSKPDYLFREWSILSKLSHENIVLIYGVCELAERQGLMLEFCPEGDLIQYMQQKKLIISGRSKSNSYMACRSNDKPLIFIILMKRSSSAWPLIY